MRQLVILSLFCAFLWGYGSQNHLNITASQNESHLITPQTLDLKKTEQYPWWRYFAVLGVLFGLIVILVIIKRKQKISHPQGFKMTQHYLSKDSKIITLENQEKIFTLFSNEKGCVLLDSQSKDSKED